MEQAVSRVHMALSAADAAGVPRRLFVDISSLLHHHFHCAGPSLLELARAAFTAQEGSPEHTAAWIHLYKAVYTEAETGVFSSFFAALGPGEYAVSFFFEHGAARFMLFAFLFLLRVANPVVLQQPLEKWSA